MQRPEGDGIVCDYCGDTAHTDFTYYSFDFHKIQVINRQRGQSSDAILSVDLCETCMGIYRERVKVAYAPPTSNRFNCDVSGEAITAVNFIYYRCNVSKAEVNLSGASFICDTCDQPRAPNAGPCEQCTPDTKLLRNAEMKIDDKYLELNFSENMYTKFKAHTEHVKTGVNEWSADSH